MLLYYYAGIKNSVLMFIRALAVILIIISSVKVLSELVQLLHGCCEPEKSGHRKHWWLYFYYLADLANWLELPLYVFTIIFASSQLNTECTCIQTWQWSIGIAALFLAWASLILFLRKLDLFGMIININNIIHVDIYYYDMHTHK